MIFKIDSRKGIRPVESSWLPKEVELEKYLLPPQGAEDPILESSVFGEPLLLLSNQVKTRQKKRADILALDRVGNAVIVELKRSIGVLGVETQALQYLADFSSYRGEDFLSHFCDGAVSLREQVLGFLGDDVHIEDINRHSRIILMARGFDPVIYSMGEWFSKCGVAFRCIEYTPFEVANERFLSFSIAFDRSPESLYPLTFQNRAREPGYFWHNIGEASDRWWHFLVEKGQISTDFGNQPGGQGERVLKSYISGDVIIAYCSGYGAIGWGEIRSPDSYKLLTSDDPEDFLEGSQLHRLRIDWKSIAPSIEQGIRADVVRKQYGIYHPVSTSVKINSDKARQLIEALTTLFL